MITDLKQAVVEARSLGRQFKGVIAIAEALEEIDSLEDARKAAEAATKEARAERERVIGDLEAVKVTLEDTEAAVEKAKIGWNVRKGEQEEEYDKASRDAKAAQDAAQAEADKLLADTKAEVERSAEEHGMKLAQYAEEEQEAQDRIGALKEQFQLLKDKLD